MENRFIFIITKLKYVTIGMFLGLMISILMFTGLHPMVKNHSYITENIKTDSENLILRYIEGDWVSAIGDLNISINDLVSDHKGIIKFKSKTGHIINYNVLDINQVDGILGFVRMTLCKANSCKPDEKIQIQINKLSGVKVPAIGIIYTSEFAECVADKWCLRGFVESN